MSNKYYLCVLFLLVHSSSWFVGRAHAEKNLLQMQKEILDRMLNSSQYDLRIRPLENSNVVTPTKVEVNMFVFMISRIDDIRMQYNIQAFLRQRWSDDRLRYNDTGVGLRRLNLFEEVIWTPDLFFGNERSGYINNLMKPNKFIRIFPGGLVLSSARVSLVLSCPMDFRFFPFDTQICPLRLESYGFTADEVAYEWDGEDAVRVPENLTFSHYTLQSIKIKSRIINFSTGKYGVLTVDFYLKRNLAPHLFHLFFPSMLLVVTSWATFWLDHQVVMTRLFAALTTLFVLGYKVSDFNSTLPPVDYTKSVDIWTGTCVLFVFAAMVEVVVVDYRWRQQQKKQRRAAVVLEGTDDDNSVNMDLKPLVSTTSSNTTENFQQYTRMGRLRNFFHRRLTTLPTGPKRLDIISRYLFPVSFAVFNILYWFVNLVYFAL